MRSGPGVNLCATAILAINIPMRISLDHILSATRVRDVTDLVTSLSRANPIAWYPVGGNDNNLAIINLGSDPAAGLIERITNAFDAVLELEWETRGRPTEVRSPRQASAKWLDIPEGRLAGLVDLRDPAVSAMTDRIVVTLHDSERRDRPTVDIRDRGIGILGRDFSDTILSLNRSRKLQRLFLAGAFGQGGSTALSYSPYTIIVSRSAFPDDDADTDIAFTIVRFNPGDPQVDKHGRYEFLVDGSSGLPPRLLADIESFPHGTLVRHIAMDIGRYSAVLTAPTKSLWYLTHHYLFDPVVPFRISDSRSSSTAGARRSVAGNHRLLTLGDHTEYQRRASLTFRSGTVRITWWVLAASGDSPRNRITQYTMPSKPIVITFNGQKQGDLPNTVIKNELGLPYLDRYLLVHVDCDELDSESRRQLFPTTREALRDTPIGDDLRALVVDILAGDPELKRLDRERKQRYMRRSDSAAVENIRRRLAKRVRASLLAGRSGQGPRTSPPDGSADVRSPARTPIPVLEPPTFLEIANPLPRRIYPGRRFTLRFRTDADPAYFLHPESFVALVEPPSLGQYSGTTNVEAGYGTAYFQASESAEPGLSGAVTLEVRPSRARSLIAEAPLMVVDLPGQAGGDGQDSQTPHINPVWVTSEDAFWNENDWTTASVARVIRTEDSVDIFVSAENRNLNRLIVRAHRRDEESVDAVKEFYLEHIAFHAYLADREAGAFDRVPSPGPDGGDPEGDPDPVPLLEREIARSCETICGIIEDLFDLVAERRAGRPDLDVGESHGVESPARAGAGL